MGQPVASKRGSSRAKAALCEGTRLRWDGLVQRDASDEDSGKSPWAVLVGGLGPGPSSPRKIQPAGPEHLRAPESMSLYARSHRLRACRRTSSPCATICQSDADSSTAELHFHGGCGMLRVNDQWIQEEGSVIEVAVGDVIELLCVEHHALHTTPCADPRSSPAAQVWRFIPQDECVPMLSPTGEAKSFFPGSCLSSVSNNPLPEPPVDMDADASTLDFMWTDFSDGDDGNDSDDSEGWAESYATACCS